MTRIMRETHGWDWIWWTPSGLTLISADTAFDGLAAEPKWPGRIW
ncbi:hypothetical protein ACFOEZ_14040 [Tianweitania populi]|nr:hypothetical protein [Tianweitania populi]